MIINLTFGSSVTSAPTGFVSTVNQVAQWFQAHFTDNVTINITVGYGEVGGQSLGGALGTSITFLQSFSYSQIRSAFIGDAHTADDATSLGNLPVSDPTGGGHYWVARAEAKALGLLGASASTDGFVGFSSSAGIFDYDNTNGVSPGQFDFFGVVAHEFSEVMGRQLLVGATVGGFPNGYEPMDLFHYSSSGVRTFTGTTPGYFSLDAGATNLNNFNTNPGGDFGDWAASAGNDAFLAFGTSGVVDQISVADIRVMDAIGWDRAAVGVTSSDFNRDSTSDILWHNPTSGQVGQFVMHNGQATWANIGMGDTNWQIDGVGDFNGDGTSDILWHNPTSGQVGQFVMHNGQATWATIGWGDTNWRIDGIGDFNGDGTSDILWHNPTSGQVGQFVMHDGQATWANIGWGDTNWQIDGVGDFNGDGTSDILWHNPTSGQVGQFVMHNGQATWATIGWGDTNWRIDGIGDFNGDGTSDILWHNPTSGQVGQFVMHDGQATWANISWGDTNWQIDGVGDFNGDGTSDILWHNPTSGQVGQFVMHNGQATWATIGWGDTNWNVI